MVSLQVFNKVCVVLMAARQQAKLIDGNRGGKVLVSECYKYQKNKTHRDKIYWRCWLPDCRASFVTNFFNANEPVEFVDIFVAGVHNHLPEDELIKKLERKKAQIVPPIPQTIVDVQIDGEWAHTLLGRRYLLSIDYHWGIVVFATNENLRLLARCRRVYVDGTFRTLPHHPFTQVFTIHGEKNGRVLCLATALLSDKTIGSYRQVFQVVNDEIHNLTGNNWIPTNCIADFELAIITAFETEFPNCNIYGCYFHYCKSIWRHIQGLGLMRGYRQDNRLKRCLKKMMSLGFLPLALLHMNYDALVARRHTRRLVETYPALEDFFNYFNRNCMNGNFPPVTWNVFQHLWSFAQTILWKAITVDGMMLLLYATPPYGNSLEF